LPAGAYLARDVEDADVVLTPPGRILTGEPRWVEAVDRERDITGVLDVEHRLHREDVHDAPIAP
jgi:hypothetical protein